MLGSSITSSIGDVDDLRAGLYLLQRDFEETSV
jgi:hypothetical protein